MGSKDFELPAAHEKLALKFILETIKEKNVDTILEAPQENIIEKEAVVHVLCEEEFSKEKLCGSEAAPINEVEILNCETQDPAFLQLPEGKKYFRIGEVSELVGVEPYVLRYWESEFSNIKPIKSSSGHRVYSRKDVETLFQIKQLLHVEKFSIKGAKKKLQELKKETIKMKETTSPNRENLKAIAHDLKELLHFIRG